MCLTLQSSKNCVSLDLSLAQYVKIVHPTICVQGRRRHLNLGGGRGSVVNRNSNFSLQIFAVVYVGISTWMFSMKWHQKISLKSPISTEDPKKVLTCQQSLSSATLPPSNYTAALTRLTDDCSIRKSRGSATKLQKGPIFYRGWSPPSLPPLFVWSPLVYTQEVHFNRSAFD